jgi:hypothetical protein
MSGHVAAAALVREATRRHLFEADAVAPDRRGRAALALLLQRAAHRLDPYVTAPPRAQVQA